MTKAKIKKLKKENNLLKQNVANLVREVDVLKQHKKEDSEWIRRKFKKIDEQISFLQCEESDCKVYDFQNSFFRGRQTRTKMNKITNPFFTTNVTMKRIDEMRRSINIEALSKSLLKDIEEKMAVPNHWVRDILDMPPLFPSPLIGPTRAPKTYETKIPKWEDLVKLEQDLASETKVSMHDILLAAGMTPVKTKEMLEVEEMMKKSGFQNVHVDQENLNAFKEIFGVNKLRGDEFNNFTKSMAEIVIKDLQEGKMNHIDVESVSKVKIPFVGDSKPGYLFPNFGEKGGLVMEGYITLKEDFAGLQDLFKRNFALSKEGTHANELLKKIKPLKCKFKLTFMT